MYVNWNGSVTTCSSSAAQDIMRSRNCSTLTKSIYFGGDESAGEGHRQRYNELVVLTLKKKSRVLI